jgi:uncharacterized membrane protein YphA (DoxX/SURF4 family)
MLQQGENERHEDTVWAPPPGVNAGTGSLRAGCGMVTFHVRYVTDPAPSRDPIGFLLDALAQPATIPLLIAGLVVVAALVLAWARWRPLEAARRRFVERAETYGEYLPWITRLSAGLVLISAGLSRVLIEPEIPAEPLAALVLTAIGFLLLLGFAVRLAALLGLSAFAVMFLFHPELVMMLDVAGALAVAAVLGPGRPSVDDLLRAAFPRGPGARANTVDLATGHHDDVVPLLVRIGLGGAFAASGIVDKLLSYEQALAAVDRYGLTAVVPVSPELWVVGAGLVETALGIAVLLGVLTRLSAIVGFAVLTLALFALPDDPVTAHVALFGLSSALVILGGGRWSVDRALLERFDRR